MPPKSTDTKPTLSEEGSSTQVTSEAKPNAVVSDGSSSQDVPAGEGKKQRRRKRQSVPLHHRRMVQAIGRIEGRIAPDGNSIQIVTEDGAAFRVKAIGKSGLAVRLLGLSDAQRSGKFSFWPSFQKSGIVLVSFNNADDWEPQENSPPVDQMFVCGKLHEVEGDRFSVLVGYKAERYGKLEPRVLTIESAPLPEWLSGGWVDLILHRQGEDWGWQGEFHPRGPKVGEQFNSWLPYDDGKNSDDTSSAQ